MSTNEKTKNTGSLKKAGVKVDKRTKNLRLTSVVSVFILIAIVILSNIIVGNVFGKYLTFDLSTAGQNSISDTSKSFLDALPEGTQIRIVGLFDKPDSLSNTPLEYIVPLLEDYQNKSQGKVTVEYVNPKTYPYIIAELDPTGVYDIANSSNLYAVCYQGMVTTISPSDDCFLYENQYNASVGYEIPYPVNNIAESAFTNAMVNLVSGIHHKAYIVQDSRLNIQHTQITSMLQSLGIEVGVLEYGDADFQIPNDCELLILSCVVSDVTEHMASLMNAYLSTGGKMIVTTDYYLSINETFDNLNSRVLNERGLNIDGYMVVEHDTSYLFGSSSNDSSFAAQAASDTYAALGSSPVYLAQYARAINRVTTKYDSSINVEPVLVTSGQATRIEYNSEAGGFTQFGSSSSYNIAMSSKGNSTGLNSFQLYVFGSSTFTSDDYISAYGLNDPNVVFIRGIIKSMMQVDDTYNIASKNLANYSIDTTKVTLNSISTMMVVLVVALPLGLIIAGTIVYTRRKNL